MGRCNTSWCPNRNKVIGDPSVILAANCPFCQEPFEEVGAPSRRPSPENRISLNPVECTDGGCQNTTLDPSKKCGIHRATVVDRRRRMARRCFSNRRDSPVMLRLLAEIVEANRRYNRSRDH